MDPRSRKARCPWIVSPIWCWAFTPAPAESSIGAPPTNPGAGLPAFLSHLAAEGAGRDEIGRPQVAEDEAAGRGDLRALRQRVRHRAAARHGNRVLELVQERRLRVVVALARDAAELDEAALLVLELDALGDDLEVERAAERDDRAREVLAALDAPEALHERAVDLQDVDREPVQVGERRVAGAEVVDRDAHAELLELLQRRQHRLAVVHQHALGQLDHEAARVDARDAEGLLHVGADVGLRELDRGDVDADADLAALGQVRLPDLHLAAGLRQHPAAERDDLARLLRDRDEFARADHAALGVLPADERLDAEQVARVQLDDRLVEQQELAALERLADLSLQ